LFATALLLLLFKLELLLACAVEDEEVDEREDEDEDEDEEDDEDEDEWLLPTPLLLPLLLPLVVSYVDLIAIKLLLPVAVAPPDFCDSNVCGFVETNKLAEFDASTAEPVAGVCSSFSFGITESW
jgi:hypothetical protein